MNQEVLEDARGAVGGGRLIEGDASRAAFEILRWGFLAMFLFEVHQYSYKKTITHTPVRKPNKPICTPSWNWMESCLWSATGALDGTC